MVMSGETWEILKDKISEKALTKPNPLAHLDTWSGVRVIIDEDVKYNHVDVYESLEIYHWVQKLKGRNDADARDVE